MGLDISGIGGNSFGLKSVAFGTKINQLVQPMRRFLTRISKLVATAAGTAHTLTVLRPIGRTTASAAFASGQAVINLVADPGTTVASNAIAANDLVAVRESDGITRLYTVSSVSGLAITMTGNFTTGGAAGADVWDFGIASDTDPYTGQAHQAYNVPASATTTWSDTVGGVAASNNRDEPLLVQDSNATATGTIEQVSYAYTQD